MKSLGAFLLLATALIASTAWAEDLFPDIQYVSGRAGFGEKIKGGSLTLTADELRFADKQGKVIFTVPLTEITEVSNSIEQNPGSTGAKLMLGVFASKKEEFVYVNTETSSAAEALVFKVKNKTSPAIVAKIKFQLKSAKASGAAATEASAVPATAAGAPGADSLNAQGSATAK